MNVVHTHFNRSSGVDAVGPARLLLPYADRSVRAKSLQQVLEGRRRRRAARHRRRRRRLDDRWTSKGSARLRIVVDQETLSHVLEFRASSKLVFGTDNLNSTDVPLSNKQADKLVPLLCDSVEEEELKHE